MLDRIVRRPEVEHITGLSRATLYRLIDKGLFPAPVKLTAGNAVGWRERDLREWLESREPVAGPPDKPPSQDSGEPQTSRATATD